MDNKRFTLLEKEALYLASTRLQNFVMRYGNYSIADAETTLKQCYWCDASQARNWQTQVIEIAACADTLKQMGDAIEDTVCVLDAIKNNIENRNASES